MPTERQPTPTRHSECNSRERPTARREGYVQWAGPPTPAAYGSIRRSASPSRRHARRAPPAPQPHRSACSLTTPTPPNRRARTPQGDRGAGARRRPPPRVPSPALTPGFRGPHPLTPKLAACPPPQRKCADAVNRSYALSASSQGPPLFRADCSGPIALDRRCAQMHGVCRDRMPGGSAVIERPRHEVGRSYSGVGHFAVAPGRRRTPFGCFRSSIAMSSYRPSEECAVELAD